MNDRGGFQTLRILHFIPSLTGGGAERQLALLAPELCRLGVETHVGYIRGGVNLDLLQSSPVTLHRIPCLGNHDPTLLLRVLAIIGNVQPNIVQTWLTQMDVFGGVAAMIADVPFVLSERASAMAYPATWKHHLRAWVGGKAAAIAANSEGGVSYWMRHSKATQIEVIRNGIPFRSMHGIAPANTLALDLASDIHLILFAGRLTPQKNLDTLIDGVDEVLASRSNCAAVLFGEGPLKAQVEARIACARARERIRLSGFTHELWRWMRRASVFVSLSHFEGNPNTVLEAMALGCPLVVSSIPQHAEILDKSMALFCSPNSVTDAAAAISVALSDLAGATERAAAARRQCAAWSIDETARQYVSLYEKLVLPQGAAT